MRVRNISNLSVDALRNYAQHIINGARNSDVISSRLAERGVDAEALDALQDRLDAFDDAARTYAAFGGQRDGAAAAFDEAVDAFRRGTFRDHVALADAALTGDPGTRSQLGIDDGLATLRTPYREWETQASDFYQTLLSDPALTDALAEVNLTTEELQAGADEVARLDRLNQERDDRESDRQQARRDRDAQRVLLETELRRLQKIAQVVLRDAPDELEKIGFTVPS